MSNFVTHTDHLQQFRISKLATRAISGGNLVIGHLLVRPMQINSQHGLAHLPVTALHTIECGESTFVLSNKGSSITIRHVDGKRDLLTERIFEAQNIHGVLSNVAKQTDNTAFFRVVVWGGSKICICMLELVNALCTDSTPTLSLTIMDRRDVGDWIMTILFNEHRPNAVLLTAHNAIWSIDLQSELGVSLRLLGQGMSTLLYSADITFVNADSILVASGTIFGEVILWGCCWYYETDDWVCKTLNVFLGHVGSVFGVSISAPISMDGRSRRFLASCSDDRTIRIWDVSDHECFGIHEDDKTEILKETGFSAEQGQSLQLAMAWGHLSRIWGIMFTNAGPDNDMKTISLISRGEDAVCQQWSLDIEDLTNEHDPQREALKVFDSDRHHVGKNAWSMATSIRGGLPVFLTGGADGKIISRTFINTNGAIRSSMRFRDIFNTLSHVSAGALKQYVVFSSGNIVATTDSGTIVKTRVGHTDLWTVISSFSDQGSVTLCSNSSRNMTFYCLSDGSLHVYDDEANRIVKGGVCLPSHASWMRIVYSGKASPTQDIVYLLANLYGNQLPQLCILTITDRNMDMQLLALQTPPDFVITSALYDHARELLVCGSRAGALAIVDTSIRSISPIVHCACVRHVHGCDSVLSIVAVPNHLETLSTKCMYILTTGRDGTFAIHKIGTKTDANRYMRLDTVHRSQPPLGPSIEGAYFATTPGRDRALLLYGFKSKEFVVWDETNQNTLLRVECGGMHRSWNYLPTEDGVGTFVWTKAGTFNLYQELRPRHSVVQQGGHGREIKALALCNLSASPTPAELDARHRVLLATGAEDTEIRLWLHTNTSTICTTVLRFHTTGLQALAFSSCGRFLFSSGGAEEFLIWRLNDVPIVGIGAVMVGQLAKTEDDVDARIMGFDVTGVHTEESGPSRFLIVMAYSNGKAKIIEFEHDDFGDRSSLTLTRQYIIGTLCLSQACFLSTRRSVSLVVGATDGYIRFAPAGATNEAITSHRVHQSNIATMAVLTLNEKLSIIATGGDDNALGLTILTFQNENTNFQTFLVPRAHAAALTAVALVADEAAQIIYVISAGNDQKIGLWRVLLGSDSSCGSTYRSGKTKGGLDMMDIGFDKLGEASTDVADVSNVAVIPQFSNNTTGSDIQVMVVGVGMQIVHLQIEL